MKPIAFIDCETTGVDVCADRIVQLAITKMDPTTWQVLDKKSVLINPGVSIPKEATEIHGITDEMVSAAPKFENFSKAILIFLEGCDLAGYNIISFDIPILSESFARLSIEWPAPGTLFFDAYKIFAEKERRDLAGAVKFYLGREHEGAHEAGADVAATIDVFLKQISCYPDLKEMTSAELSEFCTGKNIVDLAGKIALNERGTAVYNFGKDKGRSVKQYPGFGEWMLKNSFPENTKKVVRELLGIKQLF